MTGFELQINGEKISVAVESGVVTIIATQISKGPENSIEIDLRGLSTSDLKEDEMIDWYNAVLNEGDEFTIKVKDITENSSPQEVRKRERESVIDQKLKSYHSLKKELEELGVL